MKRLIAIVALLVIALTAAPVFAAGETPTTVSLANIQIFNSLTEEDDALAFVPYTLSFTSNPSQTLDKTYIFEVLDPTGATILGSALAVTQYNSGYGQGLVSFYFPAGLVTDTAYIFRVQQNPSYYPTPQHWDFVVDASNYSTASDQAAALKTAVVGSATLLTPVFSEELLATSEAGATVLSSYGELYYLEAIPGLQTMCPELFSVQFENPDYTKRSWSYTLANSLQTKYAGTEVYEFMTGSAGLFSLETSTAMNFLSTVIFVTFIVLSVWKFRATIMSAMLDGYLLLELLMLMGFFSMIWTGFIAFVSAVIGGAIIFYKRA